MSEHNAIRLSIDECLSGAQRLPSCQSAVLGRIRGGSRARRRLSLGLVLAIVLVLAAAVALAAILTGRGFVEDVVAPMASQSESDTWTREQQDELLRLAQEQGFVLTEELTQKLESADTVYKEELMRAFVKLDLGFYPASWPLDDQAWYNELLVRCGLRDERTRFLPEAGEISMSEALTIARQYIKDSLGVTDDVTDEQRYTQYVQYMLSTDAQGAPCKRWDIEYEAAGAAAGYYVLVTPSGEVVKEESYARPADGVKPAEEIAKTGDELRRLIKQDSFFTVENLAGFKANYGDLIGTLDGLTGTPYSVLRNLLTIPYGLPAEGDITEQSALETAGQAALKHGWTREWLDRCKLGISYRVYNAARPEWRVCYKLDKIEDYRYFHEGEMPFGLVINLDARTGEVLDVWQLDEMDRYSWYCEFPDKRDAFPSIEVGVG